jgi:hypothetical protein
MKFYINKEEISAASLRAMLSGSFGYLASPYSKFVRGLEGANREICRIAGVLVSMGIPVFCPIGHSHAIAEHSGLDPLDHELWLSADEPMMEAATALIVAEMDGWQESVGMARELGAFLLAGKPIVHLKLA